MTRRKLIHDKLNPMNRQTLCLRMVRTLRRAIERNSSDPYDPHKRRLVERDESILEAHGYSRHLPESR